MKYRFTLLNILLLFAFTAGAQTLTGIWRGYFAQNNFGIFEDRYKFEVQLDQAANKALNGVTYSYKTTVFYGKATLTGIFTPKTNNVVFNEISLVELKIDGGSQACLMTCYLEYAKMGNLETLTGTYTSRFVNGKGDCGEGKVYLERTTESDFYKEDFLKKKELEKKKPEDVSVSPNKPLNKKPDAITKKPTGGLVKNKPAGKQPNSPLKKPNVTIKKTSENQVKIKPKIKPGAEDAVTKTDRQPLPKNPSLSSPPVAKEDVTKPKDEIVKPKVPEKILPKPEVIRKRNNELVKTIYTSAKEIKVQIYDNGEIDGDTITVYHNNELIVSKKLLTDKPITFTIKADEGNPSHEFVLVAENLGSIPPNTALMVITAGSKRYELYITSTEQKNAVVIVEYKPGENP